MIKVLAVAALVTASAAALSACSTSTDGSSGATGTGLSGALGAMRAPAVAGADEFQYGDLARQRELGMIDPAGITDHHTPLFDPRWQQVAGYGLGRLAAVSVQLPQAIGLNVFRADSAVTAGTPPNSVLRVSGGVDVATVTSKLTALGARKRTFGSTDGLTLGADNAFDRNSPLVKYGLVNELNQVVVDGSAFSASSNAAALGRSVGTGKAMLDTGDYRAVAGCLGDVVAADIVSEAKRANSTLVAVGERDPGSLDAAPVEVICLRPADGRADAVRAAVRKNLALTARDPSDNATVSTRFRAVKIDDSGPLVRVVLTGRTTTQPGYVFLAAQRNIARFWDGTCSATQLQRSRTC